MSAAPHDDVRGRWLSSRSRTSAATLTRARGIATIELFAVLAVTGVMIALAVSAYRTYLVRREVSATLAAVTPLEALIAEAFERTGVPPASEREVPGLSSAALPNRSLQAVSINHGRIEIRFGADSAAALRGRTLHVRPFESADGQVIWLCGDGPADVGLYPLGFLGGMNPPAGSATTIEERFLPLECR